MYCCDINWFVYGGYCFVGRSLNWIGSRKCGRFPVLKVLLIRHISHFCLKFYHYVGVGKLCTKYDKVLQNLI